MTVLIDKPAETSAPARARLRPPAVRWQLLLPALLTLGLAFRAGGFFYGTTALLAVILALLLVGRVTLARTPFAGWSPALAGAAGALALLAVWTLLSALWSDAPFRALSEFDRTLAYLLVLGFMGTFAARAGDLDRGLRLVAGAFAIVALAALATRLFPGAFETNPGKAPARLAFPLTYWNSLGMACAIGITLALHCTAGARQGVIARLLGAGVMPVLATTLYLTFSRGGIVAAGLGVVLYVVLAHSRRLPLALLAGGLPTAYAVRAAYDADGLAAEAFVAADGRAVALVVLACSGAAIGLRALFLLADRRLDRIVVSRRARRTVLGGAVAVAGVALLGLGVFSDLPARADEQRREFLEASPVVGTGDQRDRLSEVTANGRVPHWNVSLDAFRAEPLTGTGAGTYRLEWERERDTSDIVADGHSLYLEMLGELGWPGLVLVAVALLVPLAVAVRRLLGPERHAHAAFLAAALILLVHAGIDWDWEMPALFVWFFALAGVVCATRMREAPAGAEGVDAASPDAEDGPAAPGAASPHDPRPAGPGRIARVLAGLGCLLLAAAPATVMASQSGLDRGTAAFRAGDCRGAIDGALDSLGALRARPEPYELLGYCNLRAGETELGLAAMRTARRRDPGNWEYAYGLAVAEALNGRDPRPEAAEALALNPRDLRAQELDAALSRGGPRRWARAAAQARVPFQ